MAQQLAQDHRLLKAIVIGLGGLIVLGFGALIFGLATKGGKLAATKPSTAAMAPIVLPKDATIADMTMFEHELVLRVIMAHNEELVLIDLQTGQVVQRIPVKRAD